MGIKTGTFDIDILVKSRLQRGNRFKSDFLTTNLVENIVQIKPAICRFTNLPMLLRQIANMELGIKPRFRHKGKFFTVGFTLTTNRWQLEKIARHDHLNATKGFVIFADMLEYLADQIELLSMQHRYLINDQYRGVF